MAVEVGGNGSIHYRVTHKAGNTLVAQGKDNDPHDDFIEVSVIYDSPAEADAARKAVSLQGSTLVLRVRAHTDPAPGFSARPQVRVRW